jgi:hypothetical protein
MCRESLAMRAVAPTPPTGLAGFPAGSPIYTTPLPGNGPASQMVDGPDLQRFSASTVSLP